MKPRGVRALRLVESAAIKTSLGAAEQPVHRDVDTVTSQVVTLQSDRPPFVKTEYSSQDPLPATVVTAFIALLPVMPNAGPLEVWPGTQHGGEHFWGTMDEIAEKSVHLPSIACTVPAGTILLMDGTVMHRGSSHTNMEAQAREVVYISMLGSVGNPPSIPPPNYALSAQLYGKWIGETGG